MLHYNAPKNQRGITLIEIIVTTLIMGILAALTAPGLSGAYNRAKIDGELENVHGGLQEAQRQAMLRGRNCIVRLTSTGIVNPQPNTNGCLLKDRDLWDGIEIATNINGSPPVVKFSHKGNVAEIVSSDTDVNSGTILVYMPNFSNHIKCVVISNGLGIMRTGTYSGNISLIKATDCI